MTGKEFTLSPRLQFHLLRHFTEPGGAYLEQLCSSYGCTVEEATRQLRLPGSKFLKGFARDPLQLWEIISGLIAGGHFRSRMEGDRKIFSFAMDPEEYPDGIGTRGLLALTELAPEERQRVIRQERDGFSVLAVSGMEPRYTHEMHLVILLTDDPFITTIYPGMYAPPFPDAQHQGPEEFGRNREFWERHVLTA